MSSLNGEVIFEQNKVYVSELWEQYRVKNDVATREELINIHLPFVKRIAAHIYSKRYTDDVEFEDYYQLGIVGIIEAIDRYDVSVGTSFTTFSSYRVKGAIYSGLIKLTEKRSQSAYLKKIFTQRIKSAVDGNTDLDLFEKILDVTIHMALGYLLDDKGNVEDPVQGEDSGPYRIRELEKLRMRLNDKMQYLNLNESIVITYHYFHYVSFNEIATILGVSKGRVSQLHHSALSTLRSELDSGQIVDQLL